MHLNRSDINGLVDIAVQRGIDRNLLIATLRPTVRSALKAHQTPGEQFRADFLWLNSHADTDEGIDRLTRVLEQMEDLLQVFTADREAVRAIRLGLPAPQGHHTEAATLSAARRDWVWLALGVGVLGGALGFVSGLSTQDGAGATLVTAVAALLVGAAVSFALVRWRRGSTPLPLAPLGISLLAFVGLMIAGVYLGIHQRVQALKDVTAPLKRGAGEGEKGRDCAAMDLQMAKAMVMRSGGCDASPDDPRGRTAGWWLAVGRKFNSVNNDCDRMLRDYAPTLLVCAEARARMGGEDRVREAGALVSAAGALDPEVEHFDRVKALVDRKKDAP